MQGEPFPSTVLRDSLACRLSAGEIDLVDDDELLPRGQIRRIGLQLRVDDVEVVQRITPGRRVEVEQVQQHARPLGVAEELMTEALAFRRAGDEPGQIGDHEGAHVVDADDAEGGRQRGERIVRDLRRGRGQP
jgi:hypothetical protein